MNINPKLLKNVNEQLTLLNNKLDTKQEKGTLLWTNPNPSSSFGSQDINENLSSYEYIEVIFRDTSDDTLYQSSGKLYVGSGAKTINHTWLSGLGEVLLFRTFRTTTQKVSFENCYAVKLADGTIPSSQNACMIPYKIIGYKN